MREDEGALKEEDGDEMKKNPWEKGKREDEGGRTG